ncbi:MAG: bifunctional sugar-1-phosphate nucleotidylyltransferase/acetyltransferase [Candidatus Heimdallarchaeota archaeon]
MKAVILSAGEGTRLRPFTYTTPKPLLPIVGKPLLSYQLEALPTIGITEACIVVGYGKERIEAYYRENVPSLSLSFIEQREQLGTAHALRFTRDFVGDEPFLMSYGDVLIPHRTWSKFFKSYKEQDAVGHMALYQVENPVRLGVVKTRGNFIEQIIEKPERAPPTAFINAGIYILPPTIFEAIDATNKSQRNEYELTDSLEILLQKGNRLTWFELENWLTIGMPWDLLNANKVILTEMAQSRSQEEIPPLKHAGDIDDGVTLIGPVGIQKKARVRAGSYIIGPVLIDEGATIGPNCFIRPYTYIGKLSRIGNGCEIKNSIIMNKTNISHLSYIGDSIIGNNCNLGAGTCVANLRFDHASIKVFVKGELVDSGKKKLGFFMGDNSQTGINVSIMHGRCIGPNSAVGPGILLQEDVQPGTIVFKKEKLENRKWKSKNLNQ